MLDLKDTVVFMYKAAKGIDIYFHVGWFWRSKINVIRIVNGKFVQ